ncbi:hydantoinase B/oxoprolinase family protein [Tessaracoccus sp. SD287]|uniref:hydantoinase B/oxoprolinase family protein n=1 Tax=Tessaracoccus sp. SD287 TaxID=2782008 RepID=UPI00351C2F62
MTTDTASTTRPTDSGSMLGLAPLTGEALEAYIAAEPINPAGLPTSYEHGNRLQPEGTPVDPIVVEIVQGTLASVEMEVETAIARTSRSPMIRDAHDFRAGIHDRQLRKLTGRSYSALVHPIVRDFPLETMREGDVFFHNDVYESEGGIGHLPDLCVTVPVFHEGKVVCFVQAFGHHDDIGGARPGSMPSGATSVHEEGLSVPPIKLWDAGVPNKSALRIMTRNSRMPDSLAADLDAECSACLMGASRLSDLFARYGRETVETAFDTILDNTTEIYRREILSKIPDGQYVWEDYAEHDGVAEPTLHTQRITLTKTATGGPGDGPRLIIDFTGTAAQAAGPINHCGDYVGGNFLKKWLAPILRNLADTPERMGELDVNEGIVPLIEMRFPEKGTLLTPIYPGPTNARTFVILRLLGVLAGVVAKAVDGQMPADQETIRYTGVYGKDRDGNDYLMREVLGGGSGGRYYSDGEDTIHVVPDSRNLPTEFTESRFPFLVERLGLAVDSGGAGRYRGGLGYEKHIRMLKDAHFMSIADRSILACWGVKGGKAGRPFEVTIDPGGPNERELEALVDTEPVKAGEVIRIRTTGGGGWGDPLDRPIDEVRRDLLWGKVSFEGARADYGVVASGDKDDPQVDEAATEQLRRELRDARTGEEPFFDRGPGFAALDPEGRQAPVVDWL